MKKISYIICSLLLLTSCSDFLEEYSQDMSRINGYEDLDELLLGDGYLAPGRFYIRYSSEAPIYEDPNYWTLNFMTDELEENVDPDEYDPDYIGVRDAQFGYFTWQRLVNSDIKGTLTGDDSEMWTLSYKHINVCNMILAEIDDQPANSEEKLRERNRIKGETAFLRAAYYYMLVNLYAKPYAKATAGQTPGVPLKLTEYVEDKEYVRASVADIYHQILIDLQTAEDCLQPIITNKSIYRTNLRATYIFKSRVLLYMQEWAEAMVYAQKALDIDPSLLDLNAFSPTGYPLSKDNPEVLFSMGGNLTAGAVYFNNGRYDPVYKVSDDLYSLYDEETDRRIGPYISNRDANVPTPHKVDNTENIIGYAAQVSDCFVIRNAEAYLNLAEAAACNNQEDIAKPILTTFLSKRMSEFTLDQTGTDLIRFIRDERAREFCFEGQRWFDLRRYLVCDKAPFSKTIQHTYTEYEWGDVKATYVYQLEEYDDAYTLDIPYEVKKEQASLGSNPRPDRPVIRVDEPEEDDWDDDDDWW